MLKKGIIMLFALCLLSGCAGNPSFTEYSTSNDDYTYLVDKHTDVVYLKWSIGRRGGLTVMLNQDGTPVTRKQLELYDDVGDVENF